MPLNPAPLYSPPHPGGSAPLTRLSPLLTGASPAQAGVLLEQWQNTQHWHGFHVYMIASVNHKVLYIGRTVDLDHRVMEHKLGLFEGAFTKKYNCIKLVWFESQPDYETMCRREFQLKQWQRAWKNRLVNELNPDWIDLGLFLDDEIMRLINCGGMKVENA